MAPGADPSVITLRFAGEEQLRIDSHGELRLQTGGGEVRWHKPVIYQEVNGVRQIVDGRYLRKDNNAVGFEVASYDRSRALIVDPVLVYSTYLGGSYDDIGRGIVVDDSGNAYVVGRTASLDFPTAGPFQSGFGGSTYDVFVTKLNAAGDAAIYSTYLGGSGADEGFAIAVDASGSAYVTGSTTSVNFPKVNPFQSALKSATDAFVAKLNPAGNALSYSTYLGGIGNDFGLGIAVDASGNASVAGITYSADFPTANASQGIFGGGTWDAFVTKLNTTGGGLVYSTYLGGNSLDTRTPSRWIPPGVPT